jgi:hypothetical protein
MGIVFSLGIHTYIIRTLCGERLQKPLGRGVAGSPLRLLNCAEGIRLQILELVDGLL